MVPPALPYPLTAPFRERVLALLAAASSASVFRGRDAGGRLEQRLGPASGRTVRFVMGRPGRMSPGLVMAGTGGRAGPEGCWLAWTTTALSRSGTCGGATAARVAGALIFQARDCAGHPESILQAGRQPGASRSRAASLMARVRSWVARVASRSPSCRWTLPRLPAGTLPDVTAARDPGQRPDG